METIRLIIADHQEVVRAGLLAGLLGEEDMEVVAETQDVEDTLEECARARPDLVVIGMLKEGSRAALSVVSALSQSVSCPRILVFRAEPNLILPMLDYQVAGYVLTEEPLPMVVDAIRGIADGEDWWFSKKVTARMARGRRSNDIGLSNRELEVLRRLAEGHSNEGIADLLCISEHTVKNHLAKIFDKVGLRSRGEVIGWAWKQGYMLEEVLSSRT